MVEHAECSLDLPCTVCDQAPIHLSGRHHEVPAAFSNEEKSAAGHNGRQPMLWPDLCSFDVSRRQRQCRNLDFAARSQREGHDSARTRYIAQDLSANHRILIASSYISDVAIDSEDRVGVRAGFAED